MMMKLLLLFVTLLLVVVACTPEEKNQAVVQGNNAVQVEEQQGVTRPSSEKIIPDSCFTNADCPEGELCIDHNCSMLNSLYNTACEQKCRVTAAEILTSDGETYTLRLGESSYTAAGALAWKLMSIPAYCPDENIPLAIEIEKKTTGKILSTEVITLRKGETSSIIKHPLISRISFTITLRDIEEECS